MTKIEFKEIFEKNRSLAKENTKADIVLNNGTSESVLKSLKLLSNPEEMENSVNLLSTDMYETFQKVHQEGN